ncbi:VanZ family protein [Naasia sp. SYSU D00948]|uniref:VanZ family protein n=1 Tax=Naasia sp. SYSU D00948 TaxID=2817379 RepID=UPI001B317970|nr:VanZ family protein [Naasia sp. SYSU D00948]
MTAADRAAQGAGRTAPASLADRFRIGIAALLLVAYLVEILVVTLTPSPVDRPYRASLARFIAELHERGVPEWVGYAQIEFAGNVLLFLPAGFLAALMLRRRDWWLVAVLAPAFSALLECNQALFLRDRVPSAMDVVANGLGAALGAAISLLVRLIVHRRDRLLAADLRRGSRTLQ